MKAVGEHNLALKMRVLRGVVAALFHRPEKGIPQRTAIHDDGDLILRAGRSEANACRQRAQTSEAVALFNNFRNDISSSLSASNSVGVSEKTILF
jgi:hypothetical protein